MTCPTAVQAQILMATSEVKKMGLDWPDIQLYIFGLGIYETLTSDFDKGFGLKKEILDKFLGSSVGKDSLVFMPTILRPKR